MLKRCLLSVLLLVVGCASIDKPRTSQQKSLTHQALDSISSPVSDLTIDFEANETEDYEESEPRYNSNFYKPITISVSENMRLREALTQMAQLAGVDVFIAQDVEGSVSFSARQRPFLDILKDICSSTDLRYTVNGNSVKIENDTPLLKV